ncbi:MAG: hypothetical protein AAF035_11290 [Pseudomonadota bacterium]
MPFDDFVPVAQPAKTWDHAVRVSLRKRGDVAARLWITFKDAEVQRLNLAYGTRLRVLLGSGDDHGLVRLVPDVDGPVVLKEKETARGKWGDVALGHVARFVDRREPAMAVDLRQLPNGGVEVTLPAWADETSVAGLQKAAKRASLEKSKTPEGRREMIARAAAAVPGGVLKG